MASILLRPTRALGMSPATGRFPCPRCSDERTWGHGSFRQKNGAITQRRLCRGCGRTFSTNTGSALYYLKKPQLWVRMTHSFMSCFSIRQMSKLLGVHIATAFRWRHRHLAAFGRQPQPVMTGPTTVAEAYIRYSEKGSRTSNGPGAYGRQKAPKPWLRPFRRFVHGRPSCVLTLRCGEQNTMVVAGQARVSPEMVSTALAAVLGAGAELWFAGRAPYAEACRRLAVPHLDFTGVGGRQSPTWEVQCVRSGLYTWLLPFRGIATRYLNHYLSWYLKCSEPFRPTLQISRSSSAPAGVGLELS